MLFTTFNKVGEQTNLKYTPEFLQTLPCGLHRTPLLKAFSVLPEMSDLLANAKSMLMDEGHIPSEWVVDIKIHMLMPRQFPCIPNWHCDNVKRINGVVDYENINPNAPPMYLWLSEGPCTEFLARDVTLKSVANHGELHEELELLKNVVDTTHIKPQQWISMKQNTPHRGVAATKDGWRVFVRLTHKSIDSDRPVISELRRHCQVYLPQDFHW